MNDPEPLDYLRARLAELEDALSRPLPSHIAHQFRQEVDRIRRRIKEAPAQ